MPYVLTNRDRSVMITMGYTDFNCPSCGCIHGLRDYGDKLNKSKHGIYYRKCKNCSDVLGITIDMKGDAAVWLKEDEKNYKNLIK